MHGTWKVTGFSFGGAALVVAVGVATFEGVAWVLAHIWWILAAAGLCAAGTGAAVARLMAWSERRDARIWAQRPVHLPAREVPAELPPAGAPAIGPVYHFNFYGPAGDTHAAVIRKAITGPAGDAAEGK